MKPINDMYMCFSCGLVNLERTSVCPDCGHETKPGETRTIEEAQPGEAVVFEMSRKKISQYQSSSVSLSGFGTSSHGSLYELDHLTEDPHSSEFQTAIVVPRDTRFDTDKIRVPDFLLENEEPRTIEEAGMTFMAESELDPNTETDFVPPPCPDAIDLPDSESLEVDALPFVPEADAPAHADFKVRTSEKK